ncbi:MBOAT family O-acyltransferase [Algicella marina]|uniref:Probable alginate O-acetylase AlgI n=1 Tax=Algicella marina TaxID=2683284 RepID=A0A6P1T794_9RHOB|nr:MBOAT family protein [Algicella marina]QHQ37159.1 MBOAT family protein [Algicella marina]
MLFFELQFYLLFAIFYPVYFRCPVRYQRHVILVASYVFYAAWDARFLSLLVASTLVDFVAGRKIHAGQRRRFWLGVSLCFNLGMLGVFKYFDFFSVTFADAFGVSPDNRILLDVVLPAGISFYTFQTLSYTLDIYRGEQKPTDSFVDFAAFVAFFPQLIAGPIERAGHLLPQIAAEHRESLANLRAGARLFLFGLFKKLVIADNMGRFVDPVFADPGAFPPQTLLLAAYFFAFQIYCDFSGYTDMARGIARSLGIELSLNFRRPYLATSLRDFWQRWHITLYSWLRDYVYKPLGGSRHGDVRTARNILVVFTLSGLWHGAGWNFILWGAFHGVWLCLERWVGSTGLGRTLGRLPAAVKAVLIFHLVTAAWILFRAPDMATVSAYFRGLAQLRPADLLPGVERFAAEYGSFDLPVLGGSPEAFGMAVFGLALCGPLMLLQVYRTRKGEIFEAHWSRSQQVVFYGLLCLTVFWLAPDVQKQFIYFQF